MENIILSCLESKNVPFVEHLLRECNLLGKILEAEKKVTLTSDPNMVLICHTLHGSCIRKAFL